MNQPVTYVRSEDLLDESSPKRLARTFRLSRRRQLTGLVLAALLLPLLTLLLHEIDDALALDGQVLVYLLAVVVIALVGGIVVAIGAAVAPRCSSTTTSSSRSTRSPSATPTRW